eukprot:1099690-Pleurochrysis_carterae.AAC.5
MAYESYKRATSRLSFAVQVSRYHRENYQASNMMFVLTGAADETEFLRALDQVEASVCAKPPPPQMPR